MHKRLEVTANVLIILVAAMLGFAIIDRYLVHKPATAFPSVSVGEKLPLTEVDWQRNGRTLLLVLQKGCHYCAESAPFYQKVVRQAEQSRRVHLIAVLPQAPQEAVDYLCELGVSITDVRQAKLRTIRVRGTPTVLLVSNTGVVERAWIGRLPADKESEVLGSL